MAAPASAASTAASAISAGVTGRCGDMEGVWIAPVTAQVMMTLRGRGHAILLCDDPQALGWARLCAWSAAMRRSRQAVLRVISSG